MLKIEELHIKGINGINQIDLDFNPGFNFISGVNGIGKTTILDCIATTFNRHSTNVKKNVNNKFGYWSIGAFKDNQYQFEEFYLNEGNENNKKHRFDNEIKSKEFINFSINRTSPYKIYYNNAFEYIQNWFYKNYYSSKRLSAKQYSNLKTAHRCFNLLDSNIQFSQVKVREDNTSSQVNKNRIAHEFADIYVESNQGEIPLAYLSAGYKSCLTILLGIIKQTEVTSATKGIDSYEGVILIDELDLHLHPEWQGRLIEILKWLVPQAQVIATTHSPHIIQVAGPSEIIPLGYSKEGKTIIRDVPSNKYGFQGWSVEEILTDVMGMKNTHSDLYLDTLNEFDVALTNFDREKAKMLYSRIDKMLHPQNHLRKVYKIQMASLESVYNDKNT
ncbi:AAA family ATPase [Bacillus haikouensis]|nr:AAA family ATPase [Bacillus haikouensis]